jgi:hypothetical protein
MTHQQQALLHKCTYRMPGGWLYHGQPSPLPRVTCSPRIPLSQRGARKVYTFSGRPVGALGRPIFASHANASRTSRARPPSMAFVPDPPCD